MQSADQQQLLDLWLKEHRGLLFKVVRAYAFTPQDQEGLFQEIATQLWRSLASFRGESSAPTWLYRVGLNTAIAWTRNERKHRNGKRSLEGSETVILAAAPAHPQVDWLYSQISQLNEIDRSLTLLLLDGFSYREMAAMLGISENHVGVKVNRIKAHLTRKSREEARDGV